VLFVIVIIAIVLHHLVCVVFMESAVCVYRLRKKGRVSHVVFLFLVVSTLQKKATLSANIGNVVLWSV
jgi:hypothetical protein